jgi:putative methyltransferase (TIGR04325 family)
MVIYLRGGVSEGHHLLVSLVASECLGSGKLTILDYGGAMGVAYLHLLSNLIDHDLINYHIVETESICKKSIQLWKGYDRVHFHSELPNLNDNDIDIVYLGGVLQYIEDYADLIKTLFAYQPKYFLFTKLTAGNIPTYATAQKNLPGATIPSWMFNVDEIIKIMNGYNYKLIYKGILEQRYNQNNFPAKYRLTNPCNLLFSRIS